jgi:hypothetical protein
MENSKVAASNTARLVACVSLHDKLRSNTQVGGMTQQKNQQRTFINNAVVGAIHVVSRVDGGVERQQQLNDANAIIPGGLVGSST